MMRACVPHRQRFLAKRLLDLCLRRLLVAGEQGGRLHDHAVDAIAHCTALLLDKGALYPCGFSGVPRPSSVTIFCSAETLDSGSTHGGASPCRRHARCRRRIARARSRSAVPAAPGCRAARGAAASPGRRWRSTRSLCSTLRTWRSPIAVLPECARGKPRRALRRPVTRAWGSLQCLDGAYTRSPGCPSSGD